MISSNKEENYTHLQIDASAWNADLIASLKEKVKKDGPDVVVDVTKIIPPTTKEEALAICEVNDAGCVVFYCGNAHYEAYNQFDIDALNITPTLEEATDMLFMVKMEKELGGEDFEI